MPAPLGNKNRRIHGMEQSSEYASYRTARQRCTNPNHPKFKDYGGRGIQFLFPSFVEFFAELGIRPKGLVLDRIDNNGHYEPGNVRWTTHSISMFNRRKWAKH